ncbi:hypothetical protein NPIL_434791 [Nephila pilipes]|uniref:Uncharacterized protein n=1 Tax=Nephila pilipes TaxID=299642 RepID=A0A8X6IB90_NEPPI|nr:hypothetical protein NPIL_434791 [Nephila pilipes]
MPPRYPSAKIGFIVSDMPYYDSSRYGIKRSFPAANGVRVLGRRRFSIALHDHITYGSLTEHETSFEIKPHTLQVASSKRYKLHSTRKFCLDNFCKKMSR